MSLRTPAGAGRNETATHTHAVAATAVAAGAALGAISRFLLTAAIDALNLGPGAIGDAAITTTINLAGCFLFGVISTVSFSNPTLKAACGTGFCGGFTTFSGFLLLLLTQSGNSTSLLVGVLLIHLLGCPIAVWLAAKCLRGQP